jgi:two-component system, cell cycle response regulator CpdR
MAAILVVEDDDSVRAFTQRALSADGHAVEVAVDGDDGLERVSAATSPYDLVLSDIRMPVMDGIEMARRIAEIRPDMPILLMTGYAEQRERALELDGVVKGVVDKPFTLPQLRQRVRQALG